MAPARVLAVVALALLATTCVHIVRADEVTDTAGAGRELLQGHGGTTQGRAFDASGAQKHLTKRNVTNTGRRLLTADAAVEAVASAGRQLLTGGPRPFDKVDQHKQPAKPVLARKAFDIKTPTGRLLLTADAAVEAVASAGRQLLTGGPRPFDKVDQHKQPAKPVLARKAFDIKTPTGRLLLTADAAVEAVASAGRQLLTGGPRPFDKVDQHKQPAKPVLARKAFDIKTPTGRLLLTADAAVEAVASAGRQLLTGGPRPFDKVDQHKQPAKPVLARKAFDIKTPTGRLLLTADAAVEAVASAGRQLLTGGPRPFDKVDQHKQPAKPVLARKAFDIKTPTGL